ncbi:hypothetical protein TNCV_4783351 [Trichonephila clavipes]|nr:hypothetical protein TNCV_4783351 [Trichonephila clavipes]
MLQVRLKYVRSLLQIEIDSPGPTPDVRLALETELEEVESQLKELEDFVFPKKTIKNPPATEKNEINTNNSYEVLDAVMTDVEVVTPAFLSKPIFMKIFDSITWSFKTYTEIFPQLQIPMLKRLERDENVNDIFKYVAVSTCKSKLTPSKKPIESRNASTVTTSITPPPTVI